MMDTTKVVNVFDGKLREAVIQEGNYCRLIWWPEHLTKQGHFPGNRVADAVLVEGATSYYYSGWALYDAEREARTQIVRERIAALEAELRAEQTKLFALYVTQV